MALLARQPHRRHRNHRQLPNQKTPAGSPTKGIVSVDRTKLTGAELIDPTKTWWKTKLGEFAATL